MAIVDLTDAYVRNLPVPTTKRIEISDKMRPGLRLRISPSGRMKWVYEKRVKGGAKRKHDLGTYPHTSIKEARRRALEIQVESERGHDRVLAERERNEREKRDRENAVPLRRVLESYYELHVSNLRTGDAVMSALWVALDAFLDRPALEMTQTNLQEVIDAKARTGAKVQANRLRGYLSHFSKFARHRGHFPHAVGVELQKAIREKPRERELSIDEMKRIYYATFGMGDLWGPLLRLMIFTVQREDEIASLRWSELDLTGSKMNLTGSRTKNQVAHITHLNSPALEELEWLLAWADEDADLVFTTTGVSPPSGFGRMKRRLDSLLGEEFEPWTFHDLRTGFATAMCDAGADEGVVDRILNHTATASAPSPVARVYNRAKLLPQRKVVLDWWGKMITSDSNSSSNVVRIA